MLSEKIIKVEQLVSELYGPNCSQESLHFCQDVQNNYIDNIINFEELFQSLIRTKIPHFKFWIVDTLIKLINQKYSTMTNDIKDKFRLALLNLFNYNIDIIFKESFIMNKFCLLFNNFIFYDFPENNNTIFNDILNNIYNTFDKKDKINKLNLLLQIFNIFDEEFINFRYTYNDIQINRSTIIKNYMRNNTIPNILIVIKAILENEKEINNEKIIQKSILIISQLISWIPFNFFIDILRIILGNLIKKDEYFNQSCFILYSIIKKGMEPKIKRNILNEIHINDLIYNILNSGKNIEEITIQKISDIINSIGFFIIENFEHTKEMIKMNNNNGNDDINESFNWSCNELKYYFYFIKELGFYKNKINYKELLSLCDSLEEIILYLKSNDIILIKNNFIIDYLKEVFTFFENALKISNNEYSLEEDLTQNLDEDDLFLFRKEFSVMFKNCYNIVILKEFLIDSILNNLIAMLKISDDKIDKNLINKYDMEFCLFLISTLQDSINENDSNISYSNIELKLSKIYDILYEFPFYTIKNGDFILISYYETINKGIFKIIKKNLVDKIIKRYISKEGIFYNGKKFCRIKIMNYFDRFLTKIKQYNAKKNLNIDYHTLINLIRESIIKLIIEVKNSKNFELLRNYSLLFHSYGIIISLETNLENLKNNYSDALKLFMTMVDEFNNNSFNEDICELILNCLIHFIHSIDSKIKDNNIKILFSDFFDVFIGSYCLKIINENKNNSLILKYIIILQRILLLTDIKSFKYLEHFFINYCSNSNIISECIRLLQNTIYILKKESKPLIKKTFNNFFKFISKFPFPKDNISEENKILININLDLAKTFNSICLDIPEVFFENGGIDNIYFMDLIKYILNIGRNFKESLQRRVVVKSMNNLCKFFNKNNGLFLNQANFHEIIFLILDGLFLIYSLNGKKDPIDMASSIEFAQCHLYLKCFNNIYNNYLMKYIDQKEINQFISIINGVNYKILKPSEILLNSLDYIAKKVVNSFQIK